MKNINFLIIFNIFLGLIISFLWIITILYPTINIIYPLLGNIIQLIFLLLVIRKHKQIKNERT